MEIRMEIRVIKTVTSAINAAEPVAVMSRETNKLIAWTLPRELRVRKGGSICVLGECGSQWSGDSYDFLSIREYYETFVG